MNDLLLKALHCEPISRPPIWLMRQAGRFMPAYRQLREKYSFRTLITTPELACHITQLPLKMFNPDGAIVFSDILILAEVFGFKIDFKENQGIQLIEPKGQPKIHLHETLNCVSQTIQLLKKTIDVPLIGFCGGPYTVGKYMNRLSFEWLQQITQATIDYLQMQIAAGVDVIQIFDSWAGYLTPSEFHTLSLPYLKQIMEALTPSKIPIIVFCRGSSRFLQELIQLNPKCIGFDWEKEMIELRQTVPNHMAVQGNLDPEILKGDLNHLKLKAQKLIESMQNQKGFIVNLGHGVLPETPVENVQWFIDYVKSFRSS